jgi:signal transduction histidine kinase
MRGLKLKILLLTLLPIFLVLITITTLAIYNKYDSEKQLLLSRFSSFQMLLENGDLSFDTVQDKQKLKSLLNEQVLLSEILRSDYSVVYTSENTASPLISPDEKPVVDDAFQGIETIKNLKINGQSALSIITPLVVNGKVVAVLHQVLSNADISTRVLQYAIFPSMSSFGGIVICFLFIYFMLDFVVIKNISKLRQATIEIQKGNLSKAIDIKSGDEIGDLAASFNLMSKKLSESRQNIEGKVRELSIEHGKLSSLVESVRLGVIMVDLSLNVILANSTAKKMLGKLPDEKIIFGDLSSRIKDSINISQALSFYVKSGKPLNVQEAVIDDKYYRLFMSPVRDIIEKIFIGAVVVMEDITEEKKLDKMRTEIVSVTSHQLRTPATIVKGNLEMVLGGDVGEITPDQKEILNDTYHGNERMIRLINDLMDVAKIDEGKFMVSLEPAQLEDVIADVVKAVSPLAIEKRVTLIYDYPTNKLLPVKINRQRVSQVIQNLIDNAIKYSSVEDKGLVHVNIEEGANSLEFIVKDNGIGIPEAEQLKMFERFSRGSNSTRLDPGGGSGLGLYIAKAVVEQGGGRVWFESKENEGTTFHATFPYHS